MVGPTGHKPRRLVTWFSYLYMFQVNYLGHFLLIGQLLPLMKTMEDEDLRIVLVSGDIYRLYSFDVNTLNYEGPADKFPSNSSYGRSKMYQVR